MVTSGYSNAAEYDIAGGGPSLFSVAHRNMLIAVAFLYFSAPKQSLVRQMTYHMTS